MIRVSRGAEPQELRDERRRRLARAILDRRAGGEVDFSGYEVAKVALVEALNFKCVFCEMPLRKEGSPVEHFRPKACVQNKGEPVDDSRYWWLAWIWENLLFACDRCNTKYKGNQFPLEPGTAPLPELSFDLDVESPLLIDPARVDPRQHIRFQWSEDKRRWLPVPVAGSRLGAKTIEVLGLDDDDAPTQHVQERVSLCIEQIGEAIRDGDTQKVRREWERCIRSLFRPRQPFHAVTWDALDWHFPESVRREWGVELPVLGSFRPAPPAPLFEDPPGLERLPEQLQLRVRALGSYAAWEEARSTLKDVLRLRSWTDDELARLFAREKATIQGWRRRLEQADP